MSHNSHADTYEISQKLPTTAESLRSSWRQNAQHKLAQFGVLVGSAYSFDPRDAETVFAVITTSRPTTVEKDS